MDERLSLKSLVKINNFILHHTLKMSRGDVDELQEGYGEAVDGSETGRAENDEHIMMNTEHEVS